MLVLSKSEMVVGDQVDVKLELKFVVVMWSGAIPEAACSLLLH